MKSLAEKREYARAWREENRVKIRLYLRDYMRVRRSDPSVRKQESEAMARRRSENPEIRQRDRDSASAWCRLHPDRKVDSQTRFKLRKRGVFTEDIPRLEVFERDKWCCQICHTQLNASDRVPNPRAPTVDHIVPLCKGGKHSRSNVQTACYACNVRKGRK